jgi:hypothetical protein
VRQSKGRCRQRGPICALRGGVAVGGKESISRPNSRSSQSSSQGRHRCALRIQALVGPQRTRKKLCGAACQDSGGAVFNFKGVFARNILLDDLYLFGVLLHALYAFRSCPYKPLSARASYVACLLITSYCTEKKPRVSSFRLPSKPIRVRFYSTTTQSEPKALLLTLEYRTLDSNDVSRNFIGSCLFQIIKTNSAYCTLLQSAVLVMVMKMYTMLPLGRREDLLILSRLDR